MSDDSPQSHAQHQPLMAINNSLSTDNIPKTTPPITATNLKTLENFHQSRSRSDFEIRKVRRKLDPGTDDAITLVSEIIRKYEYEQGLYADGRETAIFVKTCPSPTKQLPGKRGASGNLELLVLNEKSISRAGDLKHLSDLVRHITELDLAKNNISDWREVVKILRRTPRLEHCNLSHNPLSTPTPLEWSPTNSIHLARMQSLVLNGTSVRWDSLILLMRNMPNLEELHLSLNDYSNRSRLPVSLMESKFSNIRILHLNRCKINSWPDLVSILRLFPCVGSLVATSNPIRSLYLQSYPGDPPVDIHLNEHLGCLYNLNITKWQLDSWEELEKLRSVQLLCELRCGRMPLFETLPEEHARRQILARLPDITVLNGSEVRPEEREDAERWFIRQYLEQNEKPQRYYELVHKHGELEPLVNIDLRPKAAIRVKLVFEEKNLEESAVVGVNQSVGQFMKTLQKFTGMSPAKFRLFYLAKEVEGIAPTQLQYPKQMLYTLKPVDGDEFHIQTKPEPRTRRRTSSNNSSDGGRTTPPTPGPASNLQNQSKK